jgi:hypothetical protein
MIAYRFASYDTPLRTIGASRDGRYHRGGDPAPTQYLCLHPLGPHAELMRNEGMRTPAQIRVLRIRTWALETDVERLPEITFGNAGAFGISAEALVADDRAACQGLADRSRGTEEGLVVPSAALPGTRNVILFGPRVAAPYSTVPVSPIDVPASITAHAGRPPVSLIDIVRYENDPHPALEAWRRGDDFVFQEPDWGLARDPVA